MDMIWHAFSINNLFRNTDYILGILFFVGLQYMFAWDLPDFSHSRYQLHQPIDGADLLQVRTW